MNFEDNKRSLMHRFIQLYKSIQMKYTELEKYIKSYLVAEDWSNGDNEELAKWIRNTWVDINILKLDHCKGCRTCDCTKNYRITFN